MRVNFVRKPRAIPQRYSESWGSWINNDEVSPLDTASSGAIEPEPFSAINRGGLRTTGHGDIRCKRRRRQANHAGDVSQGAESLSLNSTR